MYVRDCCGINRSVFSFHESSFLSLSPRGSASRATYASAQDDVVLFFVRVFISHRPHTRTTQILTGMSSVQNGCGVDLSSDSGRSISPTNHTSGVVFSIDFEKERKIVDSRLKGSVRDKATSTMFSSPTSQHRPPHTIPAPPPSHSKEIKTMRALTQCSDEDLIRTLLEKAQWSLDRAVNDYYAGS